MAGVGGSVVQATNPGPAGHTWLSGLASCGPCPPFPGPAHAGGRRPACSGEGKQSPR